MRILKKWIAWAVVLLCAIQIEVFAGQTDIPEGTDLQGNTGFPGDGTSATMLQDARSVPERAEISPDQWVEPANGDASYDYYI